MNFRDMLFSFLLGSMVTSGILALSPLSAGGVFLGSSIMCICWALLKNLDEHKN